MRSCLKPMEFALLLILALDLASDLAQARRLEMTGMASPIDGQILSAKVDPLAHKTLHFETLPKGHIIPPSGPSSGPGRRSPPHHKMPRNDQLAHKTLNFGMLPKGNVVPPSGPSHRGDKRSPPLHQMPQYDQPAHKTLHFEILPKGDIIPPSGPSTRTSISPPPPHHWV